NGTNTGFFGNGEVHGVLQFLGTFNSISFTDTSENWHGFTVGVDSVAGQTPIPGALPLFASGLGVLGFVAHRRKRKSVTA
ncbi:MAG: hypothetical protein ACXWKC_15720, partial [Xanthobacteraceae bacterium]